MEYEIGEIDFKKTKILKTVIGAVGSLVCIGTLVLGVVATFGLSLPLVGVLIICGILPAEVILTCHSVKTAAIGTVWEEYDDEYEIVDGDYEEIDEDKVDRETDIIKYMPVASIKPIDRSNDEETKNMVRQRVIEFKPKNNK